MYLNFNDEFYLRIDTPSRFPGLLKRYRKYTVHSEAEIPDEKTIRLRSGEIKTESPLYCLGKEAAYQNNRFFILDRRGLKLGLNPATILSESEILVEIGFDEALFITLLEPVILLRLLRAGIVPVHSCSVDVSGGGILFPAWGGIGKTRLILQLTEQGARYVSDEWTLIKDGNLLPFKIDFSMLDYDLREFPDRAALSYYDKAKLFVNSKITNDMVRAIFTKAGLALNIKTYDPDVIFPKSVGETRLRKICFLQKWSNHQPKKLTIEATELASRMSLSFCREIRTFRYYYTMSKFALPAVDEMLENIYDVYFQTLTKMIKDIEVASLVLPAAGIEKQNMMEII